MRVLGIETTCDETAVAVVSDRLGGDGGDILSNEVLSQIAQHAAYGGVVPEIAARAHIDVLDRLILRALDNAQVDLKDLDAIAAAAGPGLIGGVLVGIDGGARPRACGRQALRRGQSSRGPCVDRASHRSPRLSLRGAARIGRAYAACGRPGSWRLPPARLDRRRRRGRGLRQGRENARPALSGRPARWRGSHRTATARASISRAPCSDEAARIFRSPA